MQKATLYAYFDGKSALVDAVIDKLLQELPVLRRADDALPLRERFMDIGLQLQELAAHSATVSLLRVSDCLPTNWQCGKSGMKSSNVLWPDF